jgi:hypothetical protein
MSVVELAVGVVPLLYGMRGREVEHLFRLEGETVGRGNKESRRWRGGGAISLRGQRCGDWAAGASAGRWWRLGTTIGR